MKHKIQQRKHLKSQLPSQDILNQTQTLNKEIDEDIIREQLNKWKQALDTISFNTNPSRLFKLIRALNNKHCDNHTAREAFLTHNTIPTDQQQTEILNKSHHHTDAVAEFGPLLGGHCPLELVIYNSTWKNKIMYYRGKNSR